MGNYLNSINSRLRLRINKTFKTINNFFFTMFVDIKKVMQKGSLWRGRANKAFNVQMCTGKFVQTIREINKNPRRMKVNPCSVVCESNNGREYLSIGGWLMFFAQRFSSSVCSQILSIQLQSISTEKLVSILALCSIRPGKKWCLIKGSNLFCAHKR